MPIWIFLLPFFSALIGWLIHSLAITFFMARVLPGKQTLIADQAGKIITKNIGSFTDLEEKFVGKESMEKILPVIEKHIDEFLRHKLSKSMPIIGMFIGEKTITQMKDVFMKELEIIFPATIKTYISNLQKDISVEEIVREKIMGIPPQSFRDQVQQGLSTQLRQFRLFGLVTGFIIGVFQVILIFLSLYR